MKQKVEIDINGTAFTHTAELLGITQHADGACVARAACCGKIGDIIPCPICSGHGCQACGGTGSIKDEDTRSDHAFYDIASMTQDEMQTEVLEHVQRVAQHHANVHKAKVFLASLKAQG
jgi:hypothetical protein